MTLRAINQNLLPILLALLRERNVTRAAQSLGLSQPAVSKALALLRVILDDKLLVRAGRGLVLTRRGHELLAPVAAICQDIENLWRTQTFDPAESRREFVIAGTDYCAMLLVPALSSVLAEQAPHISMRFVDLVPQLLIEERTDIDFAMTPSSFVPQQMIDAGGVIPLFIDKFVAVVAKDHALAAPDASIPELLARTPSIVFGNDDPLVPRELKGTSHVRVSGSPTLAVVQQFLSQPLLALLSGSIAVVPLRLVELIAPVVPMHVLDVPVPEIQVEVVLAWPKRRDGDADHRWFRNLVAAQLCDGRFRTTP